MGTAGPSSRGSASSWGSIFNYFGHPGATGLNIGFIVVAFVNAVVMLWVTRLLTGMRNARLA
jgi:uncharacterized membrane protein YeaQ/YmgE (transglycosylase-associated protein family)